MADFVKVAKTGEIAPGEGKAVNVGVRRIAFFNIDGAYHAIDDTCTHRGGPLSEGMVVGTEVTWQPAGGFEAAPGPIGLSHSPSRLAVAAGTASQ